MYVPKTQQNDGDVIAFLANFKDEERYPDLLQLLDIMQDISGCPAKMWGSSNIGFDKYKYTGKSTEGYWFCIGFSPRKQNITINVISGFEEEPELLAKLGKYKTSKGCLYVKRLSDINLEHFKEFLKRSMKVMKTWPR